MRIAFLLGSLEASRNGVGDYTRLLAQYLMANGHPCCAIAINDYYAISGSKQKNQSDEFELRLSPELIWHERIVKSKIFIDTFNPDFISLQFVPYAYHEKGIVTQFVKHLTPLISKKKCHIMFHELWIGESSEYGMKDRLIGYLQKRAILKMIKVLQPEVIHTSNLIYQLLLQRKGIHADILPLFGNIPILPNIDDHFLINILHKKGLKIDTENRKDFMLLGIFGTIHPQWNPAMLLSLLVNYSEDFNKKMVFISVGRIGAQGEELWDKISDSFYPKFKFIKLGEQSESCISQCLHTFDLGIATTPWSLIEKSGTAAAMLDHGLPVLITRDDWSLRHDKTPDPTRHPLLHRLDENFLSNLDVGIPRAEPKSRLPGLANQFINSLNSIHNKSMRN